MYKLTGNTAYEQVSSARGQLASRLMNLIEKHGEDDRVYQLAEEYVQWWSLTFNESKDAIGRNIWNKVDELMVTIDAELGDRQFNNGLVTNEKTTSESYAPTTSRKIGKVIGKGIGYTVAGTMIAGSKSGSWIKRSGVPAMAELCKGIGNGTKESYTKLRKRKSNNDADTLDTNDDDDSPY